MLNTWNIKKKTKLSLMGNYYRLISDHSITITEVEYCRLSWSDQCKYELVTPIKKFVIKIED